MACLAIHEILSSLLPLPTCKYQSQFCRLLSLGNLMQNSIMLDLVSLKCVCLYLNLAHICMLPYIDLPFCLYFTIVCLVYRKSCILNSVSFFISQVYAIFSIIQLEFNYIDNGIFSNKNVILCMWHNLYIIGGILPSRFHRTLYS